MNTTSSNTSFQGLKFSNSFIKMVTNGRNEVDKLRVASDLGVLKKTIEEKHPNHDILISTRDYSFDRFRKGETSFMRGAKVTISDPKNKRMFISPKVTDFIDRISVLIKKQHGYGLFSREKQDPMLHGTESMTSILEEAITQNAEKLKNTIAAKKQIALLNK